MVAGCSALKRAYRDRLRSVDPGMVFVQLSVDTEVLRKRVESRSNHFAGANLIDSQLMTLEPLSPDEGVIVDATSSTIAGAVAAVRSILSV